MKTIIIMFMMVTMLHACGGSATNDGENYGNLLDSPEGLTLTADEHKGGWERSECTQCHNLENIHLVNRTGIAIDIATIHDQALDQGISGCATCHGTNGVAMP